MAMKLPRAGWKLDLAEIKEEFISLSSSSLYMITQLGNQIITATGCFTVIHDDGERKWQSDEE